MKKIFKFLLPFVVIVSVLLSILTIPAFAISAPNGGDLLFRMWWYESQTAGGANGTTLGMTGNVNPNDLTDGSFYSVASPGTTNAFNYPVCRFELLSSNNSVLLTAGNTYDVTFRGIIYNNSASAYRYTRVDWYFYYEDGTSSSVYEEIDGSVVNNVGTLGSSVRNIFEVEGVITPNKNVTKINCRVYFILNTTNGFVGGYGSNDVDDMISIRATNQTGLIEKIWSGVTNLLSSVYGIYEFLTLTFLDGFTDLIDGVSSLVSDIVNGNFVQTIKDFIIQQFQLPSLTDLSNAITEFLGADNSLNELFAQRIEQFKDLLTFDINTYEGLQGLSAAGNIVMMFFNIEYVSGIVQLSMFLGAIGFVLGVSYLISNFTASDTARRQRADNVAKRNAYFESRKQFFDNINKRNKGGGS